MRGHEGSSEYERAMLTFQRHLSRKEDGLFRLDAKDGREIGIDDPVIFADLVRSLDATNRKIKDREIDPGVIQPYRQ